MILKYDPKKVYDPNAFENRVRRAMKENLDRQYIKRPITNPTLRWLLSLPIVKYTVKLMSKLNRPTIEDIKAIEETRKEKVR